MNDYLNDLIRLQNKKRLTFYKEMISSRFFYLNMNKNIVDNSIIKDEDINRIIVI